ncbi:MAG: LptF/LptG family permease [Geminicoccaceae bacterium]
MSVLARYLGKMFLVRFTVVILAVAGFALLFDLLENGDSVARAAGDRSFPLLQYALLRLPSILSEMVPLTALVGGILTVGDLLRHRELVIMWDGGVSPLGLIVRLLPVGLLLIGLKLTVDDVVVPWTSGELRAWAVGDYRRSSIVGGAADAIWLRSGDDVVRIPRDSAVRQRVDEITIFRRSPDGLLTERIDAERARPDKDGWMLGDVTRRVVGSRQPEHLDRLHWQGTIDLPSIALLARDPRELSLTQLSGIIANNAFAIRSIDPYTTWLNVRLANAVVPFLLVVLAFALAGRFSRTGTIAPIFIRGIAIGFTFHVMEGVVVALGEVGLVSPRIAAWGLPLGLAIAVLLPPVIAELRQRGSVRRLPAGGPRPA